MALQSKLKMIYFVVIKMEFKKGNYPVAMHAIKCDFAILIKLLPYLKGEHVYALKSLCIDTIHFIEGNGLTDS